MPEYNVPMTLKIRTTAFVVADSADEARKLAEKLSVDDDGRDTGECVDWEVTGEPAEIR